MTNASRSDFVGVNTVAVSRLSTICTRHLPDCCRKATVWVTKNPTRRNRRAGSCEINLRSGRWPDFAIDYKEGGPNSLVAHIAETAQVYRGGHFAPKSGREPLGGAHGR